MTPRAGSGFRNETSGFPPNPVESTGGSRHALPRRHRLGGHGKLRGLAGLVPRLPPEAFIPATRFLKRSHRP